MLITTKTGKTYAMNKYDVAIAIFRRLVRAGQSRRVAIAQAARRAELNVKDLAREMNRRSQEVRGKQVTKAIEKQQDKAARRQKVQGHLEFESKGHLDPRKLQTNLNTAQKPAAERAARNRRILESREQIARMICEDPDMLPFAIAVVKNPRGEVLMHRSDEGFKFPGRQMVASEPPEDAACQGCFEMTGVNPNPIRPMPLNFADSQFVECEGDGECHKGCQWVDPKMAYRDRRFPLYHQAKRIIRDCLM